MTMINNKTADTTLARGLTLASIDHAGQTRVSQKVRVTRFKKIFGPLPSQVSVIWLTLQTTPIERARLFRSQSTDKGFDHLLMTLYFLKGYGLEESIASRFGVHEQTLRKWIDIFSSKLAALMPQFVKWPDDNEWDTTFIISVDCINFGTNEPHHKTLHKDKKMFDRKNGKAGLTYEVALHLWENRVVCFNGGYPPNDGGDRAIFVEKGLNDKIPDGKKAIADKIYTGLMKIALHNSLDCPKVREFKGRARSRQESINARLKSYGILGQRFRHKIFKHQMFAQAVMVICIIAMENGSPLFSV